LIFFYPTEICAGIYTNQFQLSIDMHYITYITVSTVEVV